ISTGNLKQQSGSSTEYPMSQAATTAALNTKANTSHTHSADDITSGILPVSRGGTGVNSITNLKSALSLGSMHDKDAGTGGTQFRNNTQNDSRFIQGGSVVQTTGTSTTNVMSQKAVSDALVAAGTDWKEDIATEEEARNPTIDDKVMTPKKV